MFNKREEFLLSLIATQLKVIAKKYPQTKGMIEDLQADVIALVIDWD